MAFLSKLFGNKKDQPEPVLHNGFRIFPEPMKEPGGFRISARIEKEIEGETKTHLMIRADTVQGFDEAIAASLAKAKAFIDQAGERIFD